MASHYYYITPEEYERAALNGISNRILEQRIRYYMWDRERAITEPVREKYNDKYEWSKYKHIAKENGVSFASFSYRVKKGWSKLEAATRKPLTQKEIVERAIASRKRVLTDEQIKIAESNGISYNTLLMRVKKCGWSKEEAISTPPLTYEQRDMRKKLMRKKLKGVAK